jgi:voltage-dependent anion channel protein 2
MTIIFTIILLKLLLISNDGQEFTGSVYQKVNSQLESGINLAWTSGNNTTRFGLGCIYKLDSDSTVKV